jgi:hypothetical protein
MQSAHRQARWYQGARAELCQKPSSLSDFDGLSVGKPQYRHESSLLGDWLSRACISLLIPDLGARRSASCLENNNTKINPRLEKFPLSHARAALPPRIAPRLPGGPTNASRRRPWVGARRAASRPCVAVSTTSRLRRAPLPMSACVRATIARMPDYDQKAVVQAAALAPLGNESARRGLVVVYAVRSKTVDERSMTRHAQPFDLKLLSPWRSMRSMLCVSYSLYPCPLRDKGQVY